MSPLRIIDTTGDERDACMLPDMANRRNVE